MKWTDGHIWILENLQITSRPFFTYKYVVMKNQKAVKWERGPHRLADLDILPDMNKANNTSHYRPGSPDSISRASAGLRS